MQAGGPVASCLVRKKHDLIDRSFIAFLSDSAVASSFNLTAFLMDLSQENGGENCLGLGFYMDPPFTCKLLDKSKPHANIP
jgi:hypothetical protein